MSSSYSVTVDYWCGEDSSIRILLNDHIVDAPDTEWATISHLVPDDDTFDLDVFDTVMEIVQDAFPSSALPSLPPSTAPFAAPVVEYYLAGGLGRSSCALYS